MAFPSHRQDGYYPDHGIALAMESLGEHLLSGLSDANRRYTESFRSLAATLQFDLRHLCVNLQLATDTSCRDSEAKMSTIICELRTEIEKANEAHNKELIAEKHDHDQRYQTYLEVLEANRDEVKAIRDTVNQLSEAYKLNTTELKRTTEENKNLKRRVFILEKSIQENSDDVIPGKSEVDHSEDRSHRSDLRDYNDSDPSEDASAGDDEFDCIGGSCNDDDDNTELDQYQCEGCDSSDGIAGDQTNCDDSDFNDDSKDDRCEHNGSDYYKTDKDESSPSYMSSHSPENVHAGLDRALRNRINSDNLAEEGSSAVYISSAAPKIVHEMSSRAHANEICPVKHRCSTRVITNSDAGLNRGPKYPDYAKHAYAEPRVRMSSFGDDSINVGEGRLQTTLGLSTDCRTVRVSQPIHFTRPVHPTTDASSTSHFDRIGSEYDPGRLYYPEESYVRVSSLPPYVQPSQATNPSPYVNMPSVPRSRGVTGYRFAGANLSSLDTERCSNTRGVQHPYTQDCRRPNPSLAGYVHPPARMKRRTVENELEATSLNPTKRVRTDGQFRRYI